MLQVVMRSGSVLSVQVALSNGKWIHGGLVMRLSRLVFPVSHLFWHYLMIFLVYRILAFLSIVIFLSIFAPWLGYSCILLCACIFCKSVFMYSWLVGVLQFRSYIFYQENPLVLCLMIFTFLPIPVPF